MIKSWQTVDWKAIENREDLILVRMQQLDHRQITETIAVTTSKIHIKLIKSFN